MSETKHIPKCHDCGIKPEDRVGLFLWAVKTTRGWIQLCGRCHLRGEIDGRAA